MAAIFPAKSFSRIFCLAAISLFKLVATNAINKNGLSIRFTPLIKSGENEPCNCIKSEATLFMVDNKSLVKASLLSSICSLMVKVPFK